MLWKKLRSTTNPLSNPSVHKQCLRKAKTAELWSGRYTLGFNQEAPLGAFMERADTVHSRKRQTINRPFFSLNISIRKQEIYEAEKKTQIHSEEQLGSLYSLSCPTSYWIRYIYDHDGSKTDSHSVIQVNGPRVCQGLASIKGKRCQTSSLRL